jgi:hypothetical protein
MARSNAALWDWQLFMRATRVSGTPRLWSRFPLELAPDLIVCPHLFDWPDDAPRERRDVYTCAATPLVTVFASRGEAHRRFLEHEVLPRVRQHVRFVCLVDNGERMAFAPIHERNFLGIEHLGPLLRIAYGTDRIPHDRFDGLGKRPEPGLEQALFGPDIVGPGQVERLEKHPSRLWEALFWRGHSYRYELVDGEVPLVGDLLSPLAANRTLLQLVRDAERLEGERAVDARGWIGCGRFRLRQQGRLVEIRVRLSPADVRAAFMPQNLSPGARDMPSVLGALMAGGDNGKTELWNGFTWSTIELESAEASRETAHALRETIERWTDTKATVDASEHFKLPEESREEWFLRPYKQWLTVYVPFAREGCLPWDVHANHFENPIEK